MTKGGVKLAKVPLYSVKVARQQKGLSQEAVARMLNMPVVTYIKKENGQTRFYLDEAVKLSEILEKPLKELFANIF